MSSVRLLLPLLLPLVSLCLSATVSAQSTEVSLLAAGDTFVSPNAPDTSFHSAGILQVPGNTRVFFIFNLSSIPADAIIEQVEIRLTHEERLNNQPGDPYGFKMYEPPQIWPFNVTWNTSPPQGRLLASGHSIGSNTTLLWDTDRVRNRETRDLLKLVQGWVNGTRPNRGIELQYKLPTPNPALDANPTIYSRDYTSENGNPYGLDRGPRIFIRYSTPATSGYAAWVAERAASLNGMVGRREDPDGDGVQNQVEFALHSDPTDAGSMPVLHHSIIPLDSQAPGVKHFVFTFLTRAGTTFTTPFNHALSETPDISYEVQGTEDFIDTFFGRFPLRIDEVPAVTGTLDPAPAGYEYHSFRLPAPVTEMPKGFMRVVIF